MTRQISQPAKTRAQQAKAPSEALGRHLADQRQGSSGGRNRQFLRLARSQAAAEAQARAQDDRPGALWQSLSRSDTATRSDSRIRHFLRIARGHLA